MTSRPRNPYLIPLLVGAPLTALAFVAIVMLTGGDDDATTTSSTITGLDSSSTTTLANGATTTTIFYGDTSTVTNTEIVGEPGPNLTDVVIVDAGGSYQVVFTLTGSGTPMYTVGYEGSPFFNTGGSEIPVEGGAFLAVHFFPARLVDFDTLILMYEGDLMLDPSDDPIQQLVFIDDFEAAMLWVVGLNAERNFTVEVLQDPLRLVVEIEK